MVVYAWWSERLSAYWFIVVRGFVQWLVNCIEVDQPSVVKSTVTRADFITWRSPLTTRRGGVIVVWASWFKTRVCVGWSSMDFASSGSPAQIIAKIGIDYPGDERMRVCAETIYTYLHVLLGGVCVNSCCVVYGSIERCGGHEAGALTVGVVSRRCSVLKSGLGKCLSALCLVIGKATNPGRKLSICSWHAG